MEAMQRDKEHVMVQNESREKKTINVGIAFGNGSKICKETQTNAKINRRRCYFSYVFFSPSMRPFDDQFKYAPRHWCHWCYHYFIQCPILKIIVWPNPIKNECARTSRCGRRLRAFCLWFTSSIPVDAFVFRRPDWGRERERERGGQNDFAQQSPGSAHLSFNPTTMAS